MDLDLLLINLTCPIFFRLPHLLGEDVLVVLDAFVPHRLEDGGEGSHADPRAHQHHHLITKHVFAGCTKRAVYGQPEEDGSMEREGSWSGWKTDLRNITGYLQHRHFLNDESMFICVLEVRDPLLKSKMTY